MPDKDSQLDAVKQLLEAQQRFLTERLQHFEQHLLTKVAQQQEVRGMYDQLYGEMERYREAFFVKHFQQPLINDLIIFYDNLDKRCNESANEATKTDLEHLRKDLEHLLARMDVETYAEALGELPKTFDLKLHKIVKTLPATSDAEDGQIVEVFKKGFFWQGKPYRLAHVAIKRQ